ncbi:MAG: glycosyltransferase family 2 protein [Bacillota bacterium]
MKLISIIVPVYNAQNTLGRCIESILAQAHTAFECILVDDGSTDGCASMLDAYAQKDKRIRVIHTENKGVSSARNTGLSVARGDYIGFVDADDWIEPGMFEHLYGLIEREQADIAVCGYREESAGMPQTCPVSGAAPARAVVLSAKQAYAMALAPDSFKGFLWNKLFRNVFFTPEGHRLRLDVSVHICEDLLCLCQCLCRAQKIVYDPVPLYHYTVAESSATNSLFSARKATLLDARRKIADLTRQNYPELSRIAERLYITDAVYISILALHSGSGPAVAGLDIKRIRKRIFGYCFAKGSGLKNKCMALALCISPHAAHALWRLSRGNKSGSGHDTQA